MNSDVDTSVSSEQLAADDTALDQELQRILKGSDDSEIDG